MGKSIGTRRKMKRLRQKNGRQKMMKKGGRIWLLPPGSRPRMCGAASDGDRRKPLDGARGGLLGSFHVHVMCTSIGAMNIRLKRALTPSPCSHPMGEGGREAG